MAKTAASSTAAARGELAIGGDDSEIEARMTRMFCLWLAARTGGTADRFLFIPAAQLQDLVDRARILESFVAHGASGSASASAAPAGVTSQAEKNPPIA